MVVGKIKYFILVSYVVFILSSCNRESIEVQGVQDSLRIILPLYSFPTDMHGEIWRTVAMVGDSVPIIVIWGINDTNDVGIYREYLSLLSKAKYIRLVSYVATANGTRPIEEVLQKIDYYVSNFNISGIFLDEVNNSEATLSYYKRIISYIHSFPDIHLVILNSSYATLDFITNTGADIVVIFEDDVSEWKHFNKQEYMQISPKYKAVIINNVWFRYRMKKLIEQAAKYKIGNVYISDREYDKLPSYWNDEVNIVHQINKNLN